MTLSCLPCGFAGPPRAATRGVARRGGGGGGSGGREPERTRELTRVGDEDGDGDGNGNGPWARCKGPEAPRARGAVSAGEACAGAPRRAQVRVCVRASGAGHGGDVGDVQ